MNNFIPACRYTTYLEGVNDDSLEKQIKLFFKRLHPILKAAKNEGEIDSRFILKQFMIRPDLYDSIPDYMHCVVTNFLIGQNENYVESIGSVFKQHFPPNRNVRLDHLDEEVMIHWNGPSIPHCDNIVNETRCLSLSTRCSKKQNYFTYDTCMTLLIQRSKQKCLLFRGLRFFLYVSFTPP